ncbi:hypothetical protein ACTFIU_005456 [Dictyostelium citrinum]
MATQDKTQKFFSCRDEYKNSRILMGNTSSYQRLEEENDYNNNNNERSKVEIEINLKKVNVLSFIEKLNKIDENIKLIKLKKKELKNFLKEFNEIESGIEFGGSIKMLGKDFELLIHKTYSMIKNLNNSNLDSAYKLIKNAKAMKMEKLLPILISFRQILRSYLELLKKETNPEYSLSTSDEPIYYDIYAIEVDKPRTREICQVWGLYTDARMLIQEIGLFCIEKDSILNRIDYNLNAGSIESICGDGGGCVLAIQKRKKRIYLLYIFLILNPVMLFIFLLKLVITFIFS